MRFLANAWSSGARAGSLMIGELQLETPCLLMLTRKGLPAFITHDLLENLHPDALALQISPIHFLEAPPPSVVAAVGGVHKLLALQSRAVVGIARDSLSHEADGENGTKFGAAFETTTGRRVVGPQKYMDAVNALRPDLWASLPDEVPAWASTKRNRVSVDRTLQWLDECLSLHAAKTDNVLGVVVGGSDAEARKRSAEATALRNVSGFTLGGFGLGESPGERGRLLEATIGCLPVEKLRHVSGLGLPEEVLQAVAAGVDLFDSTYPHTLTMGGFAMTFPFRMEEQNVNDGIPSKKESACHKSANEENGYPISTLPEQNGNHNMTPHQGKAVTGEDSAKINLHSVSHRYDVSPILEGCMCYTCQKHTRAYIHHLLNVHEMLAQTLLDIHNYHHYLNFFRSIREAIAQDKFQKFRYWFISRRRDFAVSEALKVNKV